MELIQAIYQRRSVRSFLGTRVPTAMVMTLLQAAAQAPSACNLQPWAFAVIRGRRRLDGYSERAKAHLLATLPQSVSLHQRSDVLNRGDYHVFHHAGTVIVFCARPGPYHPEEDCCLAAQNFMLAAHAAGLGTCPVGFARPWFALPEVKTEVGIPASYAVVMPVVVGWPSAIPASPLRREPEIVAWLESPDDPNGHTDHAAPPGHPPSLLNP